MSIKVLIVDDEPINVKLIEEILEYEDEFDCCAAVNGHEALSLLDQYYPDIIILDIMMPGMNGYEVCKRIKAHKNHRFSKVLMVSGKAMVEERLEGYAVGADDYITKPFVDDELLAKLKVFSRLKKTEEVEALKSAILHLFSHETKTPLNGILLGSQLILDSPSLPEKITEYANLVKISGERIHDLVRKILLLSSLKNNRSLQLSAQSVQAYLQDFVSSSICRENEKCTIAINCPSDFHLEVDWQLFHRALSAVVDNGIKYSPVGATVEICAGFDPTSVWFQVTDEGPGMDPAIQDKIFDAFYSRNIENHSHSTALSLAIAKEIMQLHRGNLEVTNAPAQGARFLFTLPVTAMKNDRS
ncbi:MAG: response regulator [Thermodesulfobacteriota bacterium]